MEHRQIILEKFKRSSININIRSSIEALVKMLIPTEDLMCPFWWTDPLPKKAQKAIRVENSDIKTIKMKTFFLHRSFNVVS